MNARSEDLLRIEAEVGVLLRRVKRVIGDRARQVHPDLHPMTYMLLTRLAGSGPMRAADLSDAVGMDKSGVSRQVQALVDLGLVERQPDPDDRRAAVLVASAVGIARLDEVSRERSDRLAARLGGWSEADLAAFADQLAEYNVALADD